MKLIAVDLEFNQPSGSIIQIGAVALDGSEFNAYCALPIGEELDPFIIGLTGITPEMLSGGVADTPTLSVAEALRRFWEWATGAHVMAWGRDVVRLREASAVQGVTCSKHYEINLQEAVRLLRFALPSAGRKGGLRRTIEGFGLEFEGTPHNALVDARNTLMLANRILRDFGMGRAVFQHMKGE